MWSINSDSKNTDIAERNWQRRRQESNIGTLFFLILHDGVSRIMAQSWQNNLSAERYSTISYREARLKRKENTEKRIYLSTRLAHLINNPIKTWDLSVFLLQQGRRMAAAPPIFPYLYSYSRQGEGYNSQSLRESGYWVSHSITSAIIRKMF